MNENYKGHLAAIISNVLYGLNVSVTKSLYSASWMTPIGYSLVRICFGMVMFWTISFFMPREKIAPKDWIIILSAGFLGMIITQITFSVGLGFISPVTMSLLTSLTPIIVLLLSAFFLKDSLSVKKAIGVICGISGAAIVILQNRITGTSPNSAPGILIVLAGVLSQGSYFIVIRKVVNKYSPVTLMKWMFLMATVILAPFCVSDLAKQRLFSSEVTLLPILQLGFALFFACCLAVFLLPVALKRIKPTTASVYGNLQPLAASAAAIIIGQDVFSWDKPLALFLVILGVLLVTQKKDDIGRCAGSSEN